MPKAGGNRTSDKRKPGPGGGEADAALWHRVAETVKPLKPRRRPAPKPEPPVPSTPDAPSQASARSAKSGAINPAQKPSPAKPALPELAPGTSAGLDKRTAQRLTRGQLVIDARLDLHGMTQDEAHGRLAGFIRASVASGRRCVLVITGKGFKPTGEVGVLRQAVPRWLNEAGMRNHIVALRHAQPKDGGGGALYVLLRRARDAPAPAKDAPPPKRLTRRRPPKRHTP